MIHRVPYGVASWAGLFLSALRSFSAPSECPDRAAFESALDARLASAAATPDAELMLDVSIARDRAGDLRGRLDIARGSKSFEPRALVGSDCAELVDALALIAAVALESA